MKIGKRNAFFQYKVVSRSFLVKCKLNNVASYLTT